MARPEVWPGLVAGVGLAMTLDEVVFHQLLGWHHLLESAPLSSDGLLHVVGTAALVVGAVLLARRRPLPRRRTAGWVLTGLGGFDLYDGVVDHAVLRLHQVREGVPDELPYDVGWLAVSLAVLAVGVLLLRRPPVER